MNPLRYRGYVYDSETELYYLQSRYYDPELGRFINADVYVSTDQGILGNNMFAYCNNNPISHIDPSGKSFIKNAWKSVCETAYAAWNWIEDSLWKAGVWGIEKCTGYKLTSKLLNLAASGPGNAYVAKPGSYASTLLAENKGFISSVQKNYSNSLFTGSYTFPVSKGDAGAALHKVSYSITPTGGESNELLVTVRDTFDFTEFKNPHREGTWKSKILWMVNDIAALDQTWGLLDPVDIEILVIIPVMP